MTWHGAVNIAVRWAIVLRDSRVKTQDRPGARYHPRAESRRSNKALESWGSSGLPEALFPGCWGLFRPASDGETDAGPLYVRIDCVKRLAAEHGQTAHIVLLPWLALCCTLGHRLHSNRSTLHGGGCA